MNRRYILARRGGAPDPFLIRGNDLGVALHRENERDVDGDARG